MGKVIGFFEKVIHTFCGIFKILKDTKFADTNKIQQKQGDSCYILGNGPSLNSEINSDNFNLITSNIFVVNHFGSSDLYDQIKPDFYLIADPGFYVDLLDLEEKQRVINLFIALNEKTTWHLTVFVPFEAKKFIQEKLKENSNISVVGYNIVNTWKGFKWFERWVYDNQWAIVSGLNVVMAALSLSIYMGFKKIYLFGVDHSWHQNLIVSDDNILCMYDPHFYDEKDGENLKPIPITIEENNQIKILKMHELLRYFEKAFEVYHYIQDYAKSKNVKIINCTSNSFIDAFERKKK